jgi:hypothetical protein
MGLMEFKFLKETKIIFGFDTTLDSFPIWIQHLGNTTNGLASVMNTLLKKSFN